MPMPLSICTLYRAAPDCSLTSCVLGTGTCIDSASFLMLAPWPIGDKRTCRSDLCNNAAECARCAFQAPCRGHLATAAVAVAATPETGGKAPIQPRSKSARVQSPHIGRCQPSARRTSGFVTGSAGGVPCPSRCLPSRGSTPAGRAGPRRSARTGRSGSPQARVFPASRARVSR